MEQMRVSFEVDTCRKDSRCIEDGARSQTPKTGGSPVQVQVLSSAQGSLRFLRVKFLAR